MLEQLDNFYNDWVLDNSADEYLHDYKYPLQEDKYQRIDKPTSITLSVLPLQTRIKYILVKYRRIIGVIFLILLIYYVAPNSAISSTNCNGIINQSGGAGSGYVSAIKKYSGYDKLTRPEVKDKDGKVTDKGGLAARAVSSYDKTAQDKYAKNVMGAAKHTYRAGKDAVKYGADTFASYSDMIFAILYQIAFVIIICIIFVPSLSFVVGGIVCFTLLQRRINYIKSL
jgi:hypothetical protein